MPISIGTTAAVLSLSRKPHVKPHAYLVMLKSTLRPRLEVTLKGQSGSLLPSAALAHAAAPRETSPVCIPRTQCSVDVAATPAVEVSVGQQGAANTAAGAAGKAFGVAVVVALAARRLMLASVGAKAGKNASTGISSDKAMASGRAPRPEAAASDVGAGC